MSEIDRFIKIYQWLHSIPERIRVMLDSSEFYEPHAGLLSRVEEISVEYGVNVMIYNSNSGGIPKSGKRHLCTTIKSADIPDSAIAKVLDLESAFIKDQVRVVCYRNPVEIREDADL